MFCEVSPAGWTSMESRFHCLGICLLAAPRLQGRVAFVAPWSFVVLFFSRIPFFRFRGRLTLQSKGPTWSYLVCFKHCRNSGDGGVLSTSHLARRYHFAIDIRSSVENSLATLDDHRFMVKFLSCGLPFFMWNWLRSMAAEVGLVLSSFALVEAWSHRQCLGSPSTVLHRWSERSPVALGCNFRDILDLWRFWLEKLEKAGSAWTDLRAESTRVGSQEQTSASLINSIKFISHYIFIFRNIIICFYLPKKSNSNIYARLYNYLMLPSSKNNRRFVQSEEASN